MVDQDGFCTECGAAVSSTDKFCAGCGHNLGVTPPPPANPPQVPQVPQAPQAAPKDPVREVPSWRGLKIAVALIVGFVVLMAVLDNGTGPDSVPATTTQALWLGYYDWDLKENVDDWTSNCKDIQEHFDYIYDIRDGLRRKYGTGGSGNQIMEYLHQIGKEMGCEGFQW